MTESSVVSGLILLKSELDQVFIAVMLFCKFHEGSYNIEYITELHPLFIKFFGSGHSSGYLKQSMQLSSIAT